MSATKLGTPRALVQLPASAERNAGGEESAEYVEMGRASSAGLSLLAAPRNAPLLPAAPLPPFPPSPGTIPASSGAAGDTPLLHGAGAGQPPQSLTSFI